MSVTIKLLKNGARVQVLDATNWKLFPRTGDIVEFQGTNYWVSGGWCDGNSGDFTIIAQETAERQ